MRCRKTGERCSPERYWLATKPLLYEKVRLFGLYNGLGGIAEVDGAVARMTLSIPPP